MRAREQEPPSLWLYILELSLDLAGGRAGGRALTSVCEVLSARGSWSQNREGIKSILQGMSVICHVTVCKTN